jgi:hypothetical protein
MDNLVNEPGKLLEWLNERYNNCLRIADLKLGQDRQGWLEDAEYFLSVHNAIQHCQAAKAKELILETVTQSEPEQAITTSPQASITYGDLYQRHPILADAIESHEWDNKNPSEQRDWSLLQADGHKTERFKELIEAARAIATWTERAFTAERELSASQER